MSSTGRYQSRLFNLFSRQSRRLSDRVAVGWRQAKTALAWSGQILLYPVYAAYQTTRLVSKQIGQTVQRVLPQLGEQRSDSSLKDSHLEDNPLEDSYLEETAGLSAPIDTPILQTLIAAQAILPLVNLSMTALAQAEIAESWAMPLRGGGAIDSCAIDNPDLVRSPAIEPDQTHQPIHVQGVASLLTTRSLVLITVQNQILDILTPQQQTQLEQRIIWELASYWRLQRFAQQQQLAKLLPPLSPSQPHLLPPVRLLRRLMAWVQTSPIAIAANLFREAELMMVMAPVPQVVLQEQSQLESLSKPAAELKSLPPSACLPPKDPALTALPSQATGYRVGQNWFNRSRPSRPNSPAANAANDSADAFILPFAAPWKRWLNQVLRAPNEATLADSDPAAIVVAHPSILAPHRTQRRFAQPIKLQDQSQDQSQPPIGKARSETIAVPGGATVALPSVGQNWRLTRVSSPSQPLPPFSGSSPAPVVAGLRPAAADRPDSSDSIAVTNASMPTAAPTWIETEARLVGYVKHPLEQLLSWLDAGMLWLEQALVELWRSIGKRGS